MTRTLIMLLAAALVAAAGPARADAPAGARPAVVELFTSQGCSSCPPADRLLGQLAGRDDVVALSLHVDYWDYIGWTDPFALPEATLRQRRYARARRLTSVFTPQMIVDGARSVVGSRSAEVSAALAGAGGAARVAVALSRPAPDRLQIAIGAGDAPVKGADIVLLRYDDRHVTAIGRGENRGRTLAYHNVVRSIERVGHWPGEPVRLTVPIDHTEEPGGYVVLVQCDGGRGPILGVARLAVPVKPDV